MILAAIILGILGVVLLPSIKAPLETLLSFSNDTYSPFVKLFTDNAYIFLVVMWIVVILLLLLLRRRQSTNEGE